MKSLLFLSFASLLVVVANSQQYNASYAQGWCCKEDGQKPRQLFQTWVKKAILYKAQGYLTSGIQYRYRQVTIKGYAIVQLPVCLPSGIQCCQGYTMLKGVCKKSDDIVCPGKITKLTSPDTGLGSVQLTMNRETNQLKLPLGVYEYDLFLQGRNCSTTVKIADCNVLDGSKAEIACHNNILTIRWLTDVTFPADVIKVPTELGQRLISRVPSDLSLHIFILNHAPPVVSPKKTESDSIIDLKLQSSCGEDNRLRYDALTDSCQG